MTFVVTFSVDCQPIPKARPRFRRAGKFIQTYTPKSTLNFEEAIRNQAIRAMGSSDPLESPLAAFIYVRLSVPKSYSNLIREKCLDGKYKPTKRPDLDNYCKAVLDAMNKVIFKDDSQIVHLSAKKVFSDVAGVDVMIREELE